MLGNVCSSRAVDIRARRYSFWLSDPIPNSMVWQLIGFTFAKAAVLFTSLQGTRRPVKIAVTMVLFDAAWWRQELEQQQVCPAQKEVLLVSQQVKDLQQHLNEQERVKKEGDQHNFQLSVFQLSAMVFVHLTVDLLQFLY